jgi:hypothetical protein
VEVALEGMQCLGGNGYINGILYIFRIDLLLTVKPRLSYGANSEGF